MVAAGIAGPMFISVGMPEQLQKFLEANDELKGATALIDDSADFAAYRAAGFNYLLGDQGLKEPPDFKPPTFGPRRWSTWAKEFGSLSPVPEGTDVVEATFKGLTPFGKVPDGVRILGGTYAIDGDTVKFSHQDKVPGDTPKIEAVLKSLGA